MAPQERIGRAYDLYGAQLYRVAFSLLQSRESAEDAVQDAFARYLTYDKPFRDDEHEKAWLIRVTINRCKDLLRSPWRRLRSSFEEAEKVLAAKIIGAVLPIVAKKLGMDPAVMASPFITTIVDALSLLVYFGVAKAILI